MKRLSLFVLAIFLCTATSAFGFSVDLLESSYSYDILQRITYPESERAEGRVTGYSDEQQIYKELKLTTLPDSLVGDIGGNVTGNPFSLYADSRSWVFDSSGNELSGWGHAFISGTWLFQPIENATGLSINHWRSDEWDAKYIIINDITDNCEILNGASMDFLGDVDYTGNFLGEIWEGQNQTTLPYGWDGVINNVFLRDHIYELKLGTVAQSGGDSWQARIGADLTVANVPEPATALLLASGLVVMAGLRRKHRRRRSEICDRVS